MTPEWRAQEFFASRKTLILATVGKTGTPTASYAPFVRVDDDFFIYVSALSRHTSDMQETGAASVLLIEDELACTNFFARKRITFTCTSKVVSRDSPERERVLDLFDNAFGTIFDLIRPLGDFVLFRISPLEAVYVEGFGQAYRMNPKLQDPIHIRGTGPGAKAHE